MGDKEVLEVKVVMEGWPSSILPQGQSTAHPGAWGARPRKTTTNQAPSPSDAEEHSQPEMGGRWPKTSHYSDQDGGESHWTWAQSHMGLTFLPEPSTQLTAVQTHRPENTIQGSINQNKNKKVEVGVWRYTIKHIHKSEMNYYRKRKTFLENMCFL